MPKISVHVREDPFLIQYIHKISGYSKSKMIHEGLFLLIKSLDSTGNYEKEKALRTAWENRIKHTEVLTALLKELEIDLDDYRFSCIEGDMTVSELLKIRTSASPELTKEEEK